MVELLEAISVFRAALQGGDRKAIRIAAAGLICAIGDAWLQLEQKIPFGDSPEVEAEAEADVADAVNEAIIDLGVEVPKEGSISLSLLFSILVRLLIEQMRNEGINN